MATSYERLGRNKEEHGRKLKMKCLGATDAEAWPLNDPLEGGKVEGR
jgi:hypothetical protein